jgi:hypothetical protein
MFAFWSSPNRVPIKYRGMIKKTSPLRPIYLIHEDDDCLLRKREREGVIVHKYTSRSSNIKDPTIICSPKVTFLVDLTKELAVKTPN